MVPEMGLEHKIATTCLEAKKMGGGKKRGLRSHSSFDYLFSTNLES